MGDLIIQPNAGVGNKLIMKDQASNIVLTTTDTGATMQGLGGTEWVEVRTDNFQLEVNKNYMIDGGSLSALPMNLIMPSSAVMGDRMIWIDATRTNNTTAWIVNPNGSNIIYPGNGTSSWTINSQGTQYELIYFVSTRSSSFTGWTVRDTKA